MRPLTVFSLFASAVLALLAVPLLFLSLPTALACVVGSLLLALLAIPDLAAVEQKAHKASDALFS
ncbi:hypothetical protein [Deinococcus sp. UYEF24]